MRFRFPSPLPPREDALSGLQTPHPFSLRLSPDFEEAFEQSRRPWRLAHYRASMVLAIFLYNAFLLTDYACLRPTFLLCVTVRLGIITPLAVLFFFAAPRLGPRLRDTLFAISPIPACIGVLYLWRGSDEWVAAGQVGVIIMMMYASHAMRPGFKFAGFSVPLLALGDSVYLAASPSLDLPRVFLFISLVWTAAGLSLVVCFGREQKERHNFLLRQRIEAQNVQLLAVNEELARISMVDSLTGIPNRRAFNTEFRAAWERAIRKKQPLAVLMMDLDNFKDLNDHYGHPHGDAVLCMVAHTLRDTLRSSGDMVARYGGEEFIALLPSQTLDGAISIAERLCTAVRYASIPAAGTAAPGRATISIGVASILPALKMRANELLRSADSALYEAKSLGRDRVFPTQPRPTPFHSLFPGS
jgi:diguanylate cyclase (GGDEF)-like protein